MPDNQHIRPKPQVTILWLDTYLAAIRGSVGSTMFQHLWATVDGERQDIAQNGTLACAHFVSWPLYHFGLIDAPHTTVRGLLEDMKKEEWYETVTPHVGDVIVWGPDDEQKAAGDTYGHIGFWITSNVAISHSEVARTPIRHSLIFGDPPRQIVAIYTHPFFDGN